MRTPGNPVPDVRIDGAADNDRAPAEPIRCDQHRPETMRATSPLLVGQQRSQAFERCADRRGIVGLIAPLLSV